MNDFAASHVASNSYGIASVAKNLIPLLAAYAVAPYLADRSLALAWALTPIVGLLIYRLTMVMHDCGHGTLFSSRKINVFVGKGLGFLTGVDFDRFKQRHWEHHKSFGVPGDPQGFHYLGTSTMSSPAFAWHLIKPLLGLNLRYVFPESVLSPENLKRLALSGEIVGFVVCQLVVLTLITGGRHFSLALMPFVAAATFGLFLSQLRGVAEHGVRATAHDAGGFVRSHATDWLGGLLLYEVHFNYHEEHHRYPGIPSCHLPGLFDEKQEGAASKPKMWSTLANMALNR